MRPEGVGAVVVAAEVAVVVVVVVVVVVAAVVVGREALPGFRVASEDTAVRDGRMCTCSTRRGSGGS